MPQNPFRRQPNINDMMYPKGSKQPKQVWAAVMNVYKSPELPTPTPTPSTTAPVTPTPTNTPTQTQSGTPAITSTPTNTPTQTQSGTPNVTSTPTNTQTGTPTPTPSGTAAITPTPTNTQTGTPTPTPTKPAGAVQAETYLTAVVNAGGTGITSSVSAATITLFTSIYSNGLQNGMYFMYPFIGGVAASNKFNALNPIDTDGAYRLTFNGGWTHSSSGATPNGTNAYANNWFNPSSVASLTTSRGTFGSYLGTNFSGDSYVDFGTYFGGVGVAMYGCITTGEMAGIMYDDGAGNISSKIPNSLGLEIVTRSGSTSTIQFYRRGSLVSSINKTATSKPNGTLYLGALNQNGTDNQYSPRRQQFMFGHSGLTASQITTLDGIIQTFQTSLGRNVY